MFKVVTTIRETANFDSLDAPEIVLDAWRKIVEPKLDIDKENLVVFALNIKFKLIDWSHISMGTVNETIAHPRDIFRAVLAANAYAFILAHNHPSGDPSPSSADRHLTRRASSAAEIFQIRFLDHIVVPNLPNTGNEHYFSFMESGLM